MFKLNAGFSFPVIWVILRNPCKSPGTRSGAVGERTARNFTFAEGTDSLTRVATLEFPELAPNGYINSMQILMGPSCARAMSGTPFSKSNESRIYRILICYSDLHWLRLFVHHHSLRQYVLDYMREKKK
jgi:hypothetical protein